MSNVQCSTLDCEHQPVRQSAENPRIGGSLNKSGIDYDYEHPPSPAFAGLRRDS